MNGFALLIAGFFSHAPPEDENLCEKEALPI
jgi:hypothetical protein